MQILSLKDTLDELTVKINNFLEPYASNPIFWVTLAIILLIIGCWGLKYFGKK